MMGSINNHSVQKKRQKVILDELTIRIRTSLGQQQASDQHRLHDLRHAGYDENSNMAFSLLA